MSKVALNKNLKMIVCVGPENIIGDKQPQGNGMLWHIKEELLYFKNITLGHTLLFGASTANVVPIELMKKNREVIVLHRNMNVPKLIEELSSQNKTIFICGGHSIYKYFLDNFEIDEIYLSRIKDTVKIAEAREPLYLPKIEDYGYMINSSKDFEEFTTYIYKLKK
ncbi:MAG: dihydrofolate reductase family protein [Fusobacterium gastrosuis]|uniref:dihydrofolate reductase n=1 Tax=Fusobacterium gastrosuis TaxID=1755100 RepID=UPI002A8F93A8|nr:dihydrofolate reductase family protein [Fusobacterium gastrosuis]